MNKSLKGSLFLLSAAFVWGMAFVAQKDIAGGVGVFTFIALRSFVTCLALAVPCLFAVKRGARVKRHVKPGLIMGVISFLAIWLQQWGLEHTSAGKSGFVTALYIVIVPLLTLFRGKKLRAGTWLGVICAVGGAALLSLDFSDNLSVGVGEALTLGCAFVYSFHIIFVDYLGGGYSSSILCFIQFGVGCALGAMLMAIFESPSLAQIEENWIGILYVGAISGAVGYTFQIAGQKYAEPALASILMCMESVFAALGGWLIGGEILTGLEYAGCAMMLIGCVTAQLPDKRALN